MESYKVVLHALLDEAECDSINGPILGVYVPDFPIFYVECAISDHVDRLSSMVASSDDFLELKNTSTEQILMPIRLYHYHHVDTVLHSIAQCLLPDANFTDNIFWDMDNLNLTRKECT